MFFTVNPFILTGSIPLSPFLALAGFDQANATTQANAARITMSSRDKAFSFGPGGITGGCAYMRKNAARTGKSYFELLVTGNQNGTWQFGVIAQSNYNTTFSQGYLPLMGQFDTIGYIISWGTVNMPNNGIINGIGGFTATQAYVFAIGDVLGVSIDWDTRKMWVAKNNIQFQGNPVTEVNPIFTFASSAFDPWVAGITSTGNAGFTARFNSADWQFTPPTGYGQIENQRSLLSLLHLDSDFLDSSGFVWNTQTGIVNDGVVKKFGAGSMKLNAGGANVLKSTNAFAANNEGRPWCAQGWFFPVGTPGAGSPFRLFDFSTPGSSGPTLEWNNDGSLTTIVFGTSAAGVINAGNKSQWHHIAVERTAVTGTIYFDGVAVVGPIKQPGGFFGQQTPALGNRFTPTTAFCFQTNIDEFALMTAPMYYSGPFTPPAFPFSP